MSLNTGLVTCWNLLSFITAVVTYQGRSKNMSFSKGNLLMQITSNAASLRWTMEPMTRPSTSTLLADL